MPTFRPFQQMRALAPSGELCYLDSLRLFACLGIVLHHSIEFLVPEQSRAWLTRNTMGLATFVDLFFIISGFVISYVYLGRVGSPDLIVSFYRRRVARLVPLHWITLLLAILSWLPLVIFRVKANHPPSLHPACIADTAFLLHAFVKCDNNNFFNGVSWSVSAEMAMYLLFPLLAWSAGVGIRYFSAFSIMMVIGIVLFNPNHSNMLWTDLSPLLRALPAFIFGVGLFQLKDYLKRIPVRPSHLAFLCLVLLALMVTRTPQLIVLPLIYLVVTIGVTCDLRQRYPSSLVRISCYGQLTYSIYMWHALVIFSMMNVLGDKILHLSTPSAIALEALTFLVIFATSLVSYIYVETPLRRAIDGAGGNRKSSKVPDRNVLSTN